MNGGVLPQPELRPDLIRRIMATLYEVFCFVIPGGMKPIPISIESTASVGTLASKVRREQQRTAGQFELDLLELYQVDVPGETEKIRIQVARDKMQTINLEDKKLDFLLKHSVRFTVLVHSRKCFILLFYFLLKVSLLEPCIDCTRRSCDIMALWSRLTHTPKPSSNQ
jgi:hypothetical protein